MLHLQIFAFNPFQENTVLLYNDAGDSAIIDPGCYDTDEQLALATFISDHNLRPRLLLLTHTHLDHVFGLQWAAEEYGLKPWLHRNEEQVLKRAPIAASMYGLACTPYTGELQWLEAGESVLLGNDTLEVIFAPGHSPGHVCFYHRTQGFLIGGDVLFQGSIGRTDLPGGNHEVLLESIRTELYTLPGPTVVYPGHGPSTTIEAEKHSNPFVRG